MILIVQLYQQAQYWLWLCPLLSPAAVSWSGLSNLLILWSRITWTWRPPLRRTGCCTTTLSLKRTPPLWTVITPLSLAPSPPHGLKTSSMACLTRTGPRRARCRSADTMPLIQSLQDMPMIVFMRTGWLCPHPQKPWRRSIAKGNQTNQVTNQ